MGPEPGFRPLRFDWSARRRRHAGGDRGGSRGGRNVTGLPLTPEPATVAVSVLVPGTDPSVHWVSVTFPAESVVCEAPATGPSPRRDREDYNDSGNRPLLDIRHDHGRRIRNCGADFRALTGHRCSGDTGRRRPGTYRVEGDGIPTDARSGHGGGESILTRRGSEHPGRGTRHAGRAGSVLVEAPVTDTSARGDSEAYRTPGDADLTRVLDDHKGAPRPLPSPPSRSESPPKSPRRWMEPYRSRQR